MRAGRLPRFGYEYAHRFATIAEQLAAVKIDGLDTVGAFVDRSDARIAIELRRAALLDEAHAAMHLHAEAGDFNADIGAARLRERRQQIFAGFVAAIGGDGGRIADRARGLDLRLHRHQHAAHIGMRDDETAALLAILRVRQCLLIRRLGDRDALHADIEPRGIHHREHSVEAAVLFADQPTSRAFVSQRARG